MTPQEKAKSLYDFFMYMQDGEAPVGFTHEMAVIAANMTANEVLENLYGLDAFHERQYWKEVIEEINKIQPEPSLPPEGLKDSFVANIEIPKNTLQYIKNKKS